MNSRAASTVLDALQAFRASPPICPVKNAEENVFLQGGMLTWDADLTPYMKRPLSLWASNEVESIIFVAPAQTGKTQGLVDNGVAYVVLATKSDVMVIEKTGRDALDSSKRRFGPMFRRSRALRNQLMPGRHADGLLNKQFKSGNMLTIGHPSKNVVSGKAIRFIAMPDYDRYPDDAGGEGAFYFLAKKRTTSFMSLGLTVVESSPGGIILDPKWSASTPHEAPPSAGIASLYNLGTRERWYWPCPECEEYYEAGPGLKTVWVPDDGPIMERAERAMLVCTNCGSHIDPALKRELNARAVWVPDGMTVDRNGELHGEAPANKAVSFWLHGTAAAYQPLSGLVVNYLNALKVFNDTGEEGDLQATVNADQGWPYLPRLSAAAREYDSLMDRRENLLKRHVPEGVRFLTAAIDVQASKFAVLVVGWGAHQEQWIIDRFDLKYSNRGPEVLVEPASYIEDWQILIKHVIKKRYPLADESGRDMGIFATGCDSGGVDGVTDNAYEFWRSLRKNRLHRRLVLLKGGERQLAGARYKITHPESTTQNKSRRRTADAAPVLLVSSKMLKDSCNAALNREQSGAGFVHFPQWLGKSFFEELTAEEKDANGRWVNPGGNPNESWDLFYYARAIALYMGMERIKWEGPSQGWAKDWDLNSQVADIVDEEKQIAEKVLDNNDKPAKPRYNLMGRKSRWSSRR